MNTEFQYHHDYQKDFVNPYHCNETNNSAVSDHDKALEEYLDALVCINFQNVETKCAVKTKASDRKDDKSKNKNKNRRKKKRTLISGPPSSMKTRQTPPKATRPIPTTTPRNSTFTKLEVIEPLKEEPEESDSPEDSDTDSLDLGCNKENTNDQDIPDWIDMFVTCSILLEKHIILIQQKWRSFQAKRNFEILLDAVVYCQRMFRTRRTVRFYFRLKQLQKQKRKLGPFLKTFNEVDIAGKIAGTGEFRQQKSFTTFSSTTQFVEAEDRTEKTTKQIENDKFFSPILRGGFESSLTVFQSDDGLLVDKRALNPLKYRIKERVLKRIRSKQRNTTALSADDFEKWSRYSHIKLRTDAAYPELCFQLHQYSQKALKDRMNFFLNQRKQPESSKSFRNLKTNRLLAGQVEYGGANFDIRSECFETSCNTCESIGTDQINQEIVKLQTGMPPPLHLIKTLPFQNLKTTPRSRRASTFPLPTSIVESDTEKELISLKVSKQRYSAPAKIFEEDTALETFSHKKSMDPSVTTTRHPQGNCDFSSGLSDSESIIGKSIVETRPMHSKPSLVAASRRSVSQLALPASRVPTPIRKAEVISDRVEDKRAARNLLKQEIYLKKKVTMREDRLATGLQLIKRQLCVEAVMMFIQRSEMELNSLRKK